MLILAIFMRYILGLFLFVFFDYNHMVDLSFWETSLCKNLGYYYGTLVKFEEIHQKIVNTKDWCRYKMLFNSI